jgi:diguanylate cyclase (GGDEF)-like protein
MSRGIPGNASETTDGEPVRASVAARPLPARALDDDEYRTFLSVGRRERFAAGERLFEYGAAASCMYVVESGDVRLGFGEGMADKIVETQQYFGELAVFTGHHQRMAGAVAETDAVVWAIDQVAFEALLAQQPGLMAGFMRRSFSYLVAAETQLVLDLRRRNEDLLGTLDNLRQTRSQLSFAMQMVRTDELTGLPNRRGLFRFIEDMPATTDNGTPWALLLVDVDRFKQINDACGHIAGDSALRAVADELRQAVGLTEHAARLGGDEFAMLVRAGDAGALSNRAVAVVAAIRALRLPTVGEAMRLTVSVGAALCAAGSGWSAWYGRADAALYRAKQAGGDGWRLAGEHRLTDL